MYIYLLQNHRMTGQTNKYSRLLRSKVVIVLVLSFLIFTFIHSCKKENKNKLIIRKSEVLVNQLNDWYDWETGLWRTTSWWNGANVLTAMIENAKLKEDANFIEIIKNTFEKTKHFEVPASEKKEAWICSNYINDYYDDEGWWALAWLDAWEWTEDPKYLEMSRTIFKDITMGWNDTCDGGILWKKGLEYKSTISNELTMLLAARLHLADTDSINGRSCLEWSENIWQWMLSSNLMNEKDQVQDGTSEKDNKCLVNERVWTYNQGVVLSGLVYLNKINGDPSYLVYAHKIANAALQHMTNEEGVLTETLCEPGNCNSDQEQFKGIFVRHLSVLNERDQKEMYSQFLKNNARSIVNKTMINRTETPGVSWDRNSKITTAATTSSALDALNAIQNLQNK